MRRNGGPKIVSDTLAKTAVPIVQPNAHKFVGDGFLYDYIEVSIAIDVTSGDAEDLLGRIKTDLTVLPPREVQLDAKILFNERRARIDKNGAIGLVVAVKITRSQILIEGSNETRIGRTVRPRKGAAEAILREKTWSREDQQGGKKEEL